MQKGHEHTQKSKVVDIAHQSSHGEDCRAALLDEILQMFNTEPTTGAGCGVCEMCTGGPPCHHISLCFPNPAGCDRHWGAHRAIPSQQMSQQRGFLLLTSCLADYGNNKSSIIFSGEADGLDDWFDF